MSSLIDKIEVQNWFNYQGSYDNNIIEFGEGLNVIVGDNNAGKTKLHNAIRFILFNNVVLKVDTKFISVKIDETNIKEVYNQRAFQELGLDQSSILGVKLYFNLIQKGDKKRFLLKKEIKIRKIATGIKIIDQIEEAYIVNKHSGTEIREPNRFPELSKLFMPENRRNYFFLDGEQLGLLTPLEGTELKRTINSIAKLNDIDEIVDNFSKVAKSIKIKQDDILVSNDQLTAELKDTAKRLEEIPRYIEDEDKAIDLINEQITEQERIKDEYEEQARREKELNKTLLEFTRLNKNKEIAENNYTNQQLKFISSYFDKDLFYISYLNNDKKIEDILNTFIDNIKSFVSERKTELDNTITPDEAKMMNALDRSQPKPGILLQMVEDKMCYVCSSKLDATSLKWMKEKLIPFFSKENSKEEDIELKKLITVKEIASQLYNISKHHFKFDNNIFDKKKQDVITSLGLYNIEKDKLKLFVDQNGTPKDSEDENIALITYETAIKKIAGFSRDLNDEIAERNKLSIEKETCEKKLSEVTGGNVRSNLQKISDLNEFLNDTKCVLEVIKEDCYKDFSIQLSNKSTERFRNFFRRSVNTIKQEIKVDLIPRQTTKGNDYEFKIRVVNSFGDDQNNAGGASQAIRQVSVVFGLIDLSGILNCPFIVDAPTSDLSPPQIASFFEQISEDSALKQTVILTKDLISDNSAFSLNSLGENFLEKLNSKDENKMIMLIPKGENTGVNIKYLKS